MKGPLINGEEYDLVVLQVTSEDEFGRPKEAKFVYDEQTVKLKGGEKFVTAFVKSRVVRMETHGNA